jgi:cbb3-type cytochrome oxidase subunit 3
MIPRVLSHYPLPGLSCLGLLLFVALFLAALAWVFRRASPGFYARMSQLPLQENNVIRTEENTHG